VKESCVVLVFSPFTSRSRLTSTPAATSRQPSGNPGGAAITVT
jgi:hypothetical protein